MTARLTDADLAAIEARANAATEGPWRRERADHDDGEIVWEVFTYGTEQKLSSGLFAPLAETLNSNAAKDSAFFAAARTDIPAMLRDLRDTRAVLRKLIKKFETALVLSGTDEEFARDASEFARLTLPSEETKL